MVLKTSAIATLVVAFSLATTDSTQASMINVTGTWTSDPVNGQGFVDQVFSGSASFSYDTSGLVGSGLEEITGVLTAFSQNPSIGSTTFDTSNTVFKVVFIDGDLYRTMVGGGAVANQLIGSEDDFWVIDAFSPARTDDFAVSISTEFGGVTGIAVDVSFIHTPVGVPEPTSLALWSLGLVGMTFARRRRS